MSDMNHPMQIDDLIYRTSAPDLSQQGDARLLAQIEAASVEIPEIQEGYHPVFGLRHKFRQASRLDLLNDTVTQILSRIAVYGDRHIRVFEAGSNLGYVCMKLARTIPTVIGVEYNKSVAAFAQMVGLYNGSTAVFLQGDAFSVLEGEAAGQIDCFLALNVLHQIIFLNGLEETKRLVKHLTESVDLCFFELANQSDYFSFGKGHLLPSDPLEIFAECEGISLEIIRSTPRLFVAIRRTTIRVGASTYPIIKWKFGDNSDPDLIRKFYYSSKAFVKEFRYSEKQFAPKLRQEAAMIKTANLLGVGPKLLGAEYRMRTGLLAQERLYGPVLSEALDVVAALHQQQGILRSYFSNAYRLVRGDLFHNDLSAHNFIYHGTEQITLIDFEQTASEAIVDHHFLFSWFLFDLLAGRSISYERDVYNSVRGKTGGTLIDRNLFAEFDLTCMPGELAELVSDNLAATDWRRFTIKWAQRIETQEIIPTQWNAINAGAIKLNNEELSPAITAMDVKQAFEALLGRLPENDAVIELHLRLKTKSALERQLRSSLEFLSRSGSAQRN